MSATPDTIKLVATTAIPDTSMDARTKLLLEAPILSTLLGLGAPNVLVMAAQAAVGLIETYFVGKLGTDALAGMALTFPVVMLMQMMSGGAVGGGIASAIARALGARRRADADALVLHAMLIALGFGLTFTLIVLTGGHWLYSQMGGNGGSLDAALTYSSWVFSGAVLIWLFNCFAAIIRGTGNMAFPAMVTCVGTVVLIPLSPLLIFGWGPIAPMGIAGGAMALLAYYFIGCIVFFIYLRSSKSLLRPTLVNFTFQKKLFGDILKVGLIGAVSTVATNVTIGIATAFVGSFGTAAIAGYGTASRLEYLLVPLVFGLGGPLVTMVGTCIGAGQHERALRASWIGAGMAFVVTELIGLWAAFFPHAWLSIFNSDPAMLEAGSQYLHIVGPMYGFFGLGLTLYFCSQGAGRLMWPLLGNIIRLSVAGIGGWMAMHHSGGLAGVFLAQAVALVIYGAVNATAIAGGAWFGPIGWPRTTNGLLRRLNHERAASA
ncbi:MATE family efflux transporter [Undibacterium sp. GrIS 1.8]|uniref:MATE family efflux transporter n=1 Tax=Undibacterium sp. GrIS 1.8 TaxID=3143934 RepID=UPI0033926739